MDALSTRIRVLLYSSHFGNQFSELVFQFCIVIWLALITNFQSLLLVSTYGITLHAMVGFGTPVLGKYVDRMAAQGRRVELTTQLLVAESTSVLLVVACAGVLLGKTTVDEFKNDDPTNLEEDSSDPENTLWKSSSSIPWLVGIHMFGGLAQVLDKSFLVAVERDWIVKLSSSLSDDCEQHEEDSASETSSQWLAETNVALKQIDLSCQVLSPMVSGWILSMFPKLGLIWVGTVVVISLVVEYTCMRRIAALVPALSAPTNTEDAQQATSNNKEGTTEPENDAGSHSKMLWGLSAFSAMWKSLEVYFRQPVAIPGLSLAFLYFNVLTFSGMMTAYLVTRGMAMHTIGIWRGIASLIGLLSTFLYNILAKHSRLRDMALWSISWEFLCLTFTFISVFVSDNWSSLTLLIGGVITSRIGL